MAETTFTIGSAAACSDGPCGTLSRVVVDPVARELTHLVVEPEHRSGLGRLVPLGLVEAGGGEVRLRCTRKEFDELPAAEETDFLPGGSGYEDYEAHEAYYWPYYGIDVVGEPMVANASGIVTRDTLPKGRSGCAGAGGSTPPTAKSAGSRGSWSSRRTGTSPTSCSRRGICGGARRSPSRSARSSVSTTAITVNLTKKEIEDLPAVGVTGPNA